MTDRLISPDDTDPRTDPRTPPSLGPVLLPWICGLTMMQQSVLIAAVRGPDGLPKDHVAKLMLRWLRRCVLYSAMDRRELTTPYESGGGSFTGPSIHYGRLDMDGGVWENGMAEVLKNYLRCVDEIPHHFQLHFMHAAEIIGYKHPDYRIRSWWNRTYLAIVNDAHLMPESEERMDFRLGDNERQWRACEEVTAHGPAA